MDKLVSGHIPSPADNPPEGKRRFKLIVEYDGTAYCGWQRQINGPSVQQELEEALLRLTHGPVTVIGSSRTDAGVHALGLCAHFDSDTRIPADKLAFALNTMLPPDIRIRESSAAPRDFHARYSTCGKVYTYTFYNARHANAVGRLYSAHVPLPLDEVRMHEEAQALLGTHDFAAFAASGSVVKSTVRTMYWATASSTTLCASSPGRSWRWAPASASAARWPARLRPATGCPWGRPRRRRGSRSAACCTPARRRRRSPSSDPPFPRIG